MGIGYAAYLRPSLHIGKLMISRTRFESIERRCCPNRRTCLGGWWVAAIASNGVNGPQNSTHNTATPSVWGLMTLQTKSKVGRFVAFSGSGNRLGDGSED